MEHNIEIKHMHLYMHTIKASTFFVLSIWRLAVTSITVLVSLRKGEMKNEGGKQTRENEAIILPRRTLFYWWVKLLPRKGCFLKHTNSYC